MLTKEEFLKHLREGLNHLHDPDRLCRSPLAVLFGVANRVDTYSMLQRILTDAIASLEPSPDVPPHSRAWRIYDLLLCRYVQGLSVQVVADQMGITPRHLRREQRAALEALAFRLWEQFDLEARSRADVGTDDVPPVTGTGPSINEELAWLENTAAMKPTDLREALPELLDLVRPLAAQHVVNLEFVASDGLPHQAVHPVALNQALLNLLSVAIPRTPGGHVTISAKPRGWEVDIQIHGSEARSVPRPTSEDDLTSLDMAGRLADLCGGRLTLSEQTEATFSATLTLPALERLPVLAIDDNADTLQLLQHFTTGTRYRLVGTRDPEQAIDLAQELSPQIIVLDIMMPQVDGWKVLGRLQHHPLTGHIPIIVCTILAQEELALSLGACGFLRKPVTQETLLAALDQQAARLGSESR